MSMGLPKRNINPVFSVNCLQFAREARSLCLLVVILTSSEKLRKKNKPGGLSKWSFLFNSIIDHHGLVEFELKNRLYTWSNNHSDPTFEKLDRFLASPDWDLAYNNVSVLGLNRSFSDHAPLCLQTGTIPSARKDFRYELCWKLRPDFHNLVRSNWSLSVSVTHSLDVWKLKLKRLRQNLKGWNSNIVGHYKKLKKDLIEKIDTLDKVSETSGLSDADRFLKLDLEYNLKKIVNEENISLRQKARDKFLLEGDENSKYFHLLAKLKKRKLKILMLSHGDIVAHDDHGINDLATSFYKDLFGPSQVSNISLANLDMKQLEEGDRNFLISPFSLEEIKDVVFP
jgi:hypothetical protein